MIPSFLKYLSFEKRRSSHTLEAYHKDLDRFSDFLLKEFEISDLSEVQYSHVRSWIVSLVEKGLSPRSVNRKLATLKSLYKFLLYRGFVKNNPTSKIRPLRLEKKLPTFLKEEEMASLLDRVGFANDFQGKRDRLLLELFYATGIRRSELTGLKNSDVNKYDHSIKVLGKRNKERIIPFPRSLLQIVEDYLREKQKLNFSSEYLILTDNGNPVYPMFIQRKVTSYLGAVTTLSKKSPHVLRHTYATHLLNRGADLNAIKDLLGHTSLAATQAYTHNSIETLKKAFDQAHPKA